MKDDVPRNSELLETLSCHLKCEGNIKKCLKIILSFFPCQKRRCDRRRHRHCDNDTECSADSLSDLDRQIVRIKELVELYLIGQKYKQRDKRASCKCKNQRIGHRTDHIFSHLDA